MTLPLSTFILQKKEMILESLILQGLQNKKPQQIAPLRPSSYPEKLKLLLCFLSKKRGAGAVFHPPLHSFYCSLNHSAKSFVIGSPQLGKLGRFILCVLFHVHLLCGCILDRQQIYSKRCLAPFRSNLITVSRLPFRILPILIPSSQMNSRESASCSIARDSLV